MNYNKKSVEDIDVAGKRVLCRCDFNVPTKDGRITSDKRIVAALPTIQYLVKHGARVILCSHMGKPKGEVKPELSLQVVAERLSELLGQPVKMAKDVVGESAQSLAASLKDGEVMLLENTRFEKGETKNDPELSKKLASMADIFVNDAFGTAHRRTPPRPVLQITCPPSAAIWCRRKSPSWARPLPIRSVRLSRFSAARRSPTS